MFNSLSFKDLVKVNEVIHYVGESYGLPFKHPENFIFLDQGMLPCSLHISCAFMGNLKDVPHLLSRCTLWVLEKIIRIQSRNDNILGNAIILSSFTFTLSPLGPRVFNENIIFFKLRYKRAICDSILDFSINWFNKIFILTFQNW